MGEIHGAAGKGDPYFLLELLNAGADPNDATGLYGNTPLIKAASCRNEVAVRLLLKHGARPDVANDQGTTPLFAGNNAIRKILLEAGAHPDFGRLHGFTLAARMAEFGEREMAELLIAYGADPSARVSDGRTIREVLETPRLVEVSDRTHAFLHQKRPPDRILKESQNLQISPEQYVSENRGTLIWSYRSTNFEDPAVGAWADRVAELFASSLGVLETCYRAHLEGEDLEIALSELAWRRQRAEREAYKEQRLNSFAETYLR